MSEAGERRCWWCDTRHTGKLAYEWGDHYPTWIWPGKPPSDHDHSVIPPTPAEFTAAAQRLADRRNADLTAERDLPALAGRQAGESSIAAERVIRDSSALVAELREIRVDTSLLRGLFDTRPARPPATEG